MVHPFFRTRLLAKMATCTSDRTRMIACKILYNSKFPDCSIDMYVTEGGAIQMREGCGMHAAMIDVCQHNPKFFDTEVPWVTMFEVLEVLTDLVYEILELPRLDLV